MADSILFMVIEKNNNSCTHKYKLYMATQRSNVYLGARMQGQMPCQNLHWAGRKAGLTLSFNLP